MNDWKAWTIKLQNVGPSNFYSQNYFSDYFPGYLYILWFAGYLSHFLSISVNSFQFEILIKSITTIFDIGSAFLIFKIVSNYNENWAKLTSVFYLINPAVVFNSSVWGQVDGIFTFFLILSSFYLIERKKIFKSSFMTGLAILTKPQSLAILPILLINYFHLKLEKIVKLLIILILTVFLFSVPFFPVNPIFGLLQSALSSLNVYPYTSLYAFNLWAVIGWWKPDNLSFILNYKTWGTVLYIVSVILIAIPLLKKKIDPKQYYFAASLSFLSFFLFPTRIHERYLFPFLAFILIVAIIKKSKLLFGAYILSSVIHFLNLWFVYYYYDFIYNNTKLTNNILYSFINNNYRILSFLMVTLFIFLLVIYYKPYVKKIKAKLAS